MEKVNITKHLSEEREERYLFIATTIGFGEVVDEFFQEKGEHSGRYMCITSTGVLIVKSADKKTIITMYIAREYQLLNLYPSERQVPIHLRNVVRANEKRGLMFKTSDNCQKKKGKKR